MVTVPSDYFRKDVGRREDIFFLVFTQCLGENWMLGPRKVISGEATHCLVSALDGKRIQFGIGILTKRICYYPLLLLNHYFLTNDYYLPISTPCPRDGMGR